MPFTNINVKADKENMAVKYQYNTNTSTMVRPVLSPVPINSISEKSKHHPVTTMKSPNAGLPPTKEIGFILQDDTLLAKLLARLDEATTEWKNSTRETAIELQNVKDELQEVKDELQEVKATNTTLSAELQEVKAANTTLTADNARLSAIVQDHDLEIQELQDIHPQMERDAETQAHRVARQAARMVARERSRSTNDSVRNGHRDDTIDDRSVFHDCNDPVELL